MATFSVNDTLRRAILTGNGSTTSFAFSFQVNAITDIKVYVDGVLKTQGTGSANYAVQDGSGNAGLSNTGTGAVVFVTAPSNATTVTILSDIPLARTSLYTSGGNVTASSLENDFDTITMALGDREERDARSLQAPVQDSTSIDMTLPAKASRSGKILGFNETTGNPEATFLTADGQTLANIASDIATLADIEDGTNATNTIQTVAGISSAVTNVSSISGAVSAVNSNATNINAVNANSTNINKVSTIDANVTKVANIDSDVTKVANIDSNVTTVAGKASLITSTFASKMTLVTSDFVSDVNTLAVTDVINDINTLATSDIVSDINTLATSDIVSDLNTLATSDIVSDLNTLATSDIVSDINTLATSDIVTDLALLATSDFVSDLNTMATTSNVNNLSTVASNVTGVNSFADRYRVGSSLPTSSLDQGDLFFNTTENELRVYNGSAFQATAPSASDQVNINIVAGEITSSEDLGSVADSIDTSSGNNIDTVANAITNINAVAGANTNITALSASDVIADMALLGTSAVVADMALLANADVISDMNTLATGDIISDLNTLATSDIVSDLNTLATSDIISDINTLATSDIVSDLNTLATSDIVTDLNILGTSANVTNMATLGASGVVGNISTVASGISNVNAVATAISNVNTVASNVSGINDFAQRYRVGSSDPSSNNDEGDLFYNSSSNILKFFDGSSFQSLNTTGLNDLSEDTSPQLGGNLDVNGSSIISASNGHITIDPNGSGLIKLVGSVDTTNLTMDFGSIA